MKSLKIKFKGRWEMGRYVSTCEFDFLGEHFHSETQDGGWVAADQDYMVNYDFLPLEGVPYVQTGVLDGVKSRDQFNDLILGAKQRILIKPQDNESNQYIQDLRWGPNVLIIVLDGKHTFLKSAYVVQEKPFTTVSQVLPTWYTPTGEWINSEYEYLGRELRGN